MAENNSIFQRESFFISADHTKSFTGCPEHVMPQDKKQNLIKLNVYYYGVSIMW